MENYIIAVLDFLCIILYLTFPFGMQLDDLNWYISSQLLAQHKAVYGKKKAISGQMLFNSLPFFPSLISRVYSSHIMNSIHVHCKKIRKYFKM